jgi:AcrR family transcriptional regulator
MSASTLEKTTRERILEVAQRRFTEQGYEGTSLREIAEDLGFTKAALYYHFQSKDQILEALLAPMEDMVAELLARLGAARDATEWAAALYWIIDQMHEYLDFFLLVERNRAALDRLDFMTEHQTMQSRVDEAVRAIASDVREQIRLTTAIAAVTGFDDWAPRLLLETPSETVRDALKAVVADILHLKPTRSRRA